MCNCKDLPPVYNSKKVAGIGKTILANEATADLKLKIPTETIIGSAAGVGVNILLKIAADNDFGNSPLADKATLATVQAAGGLGVMLFSKSEIATAAGLTVLTGAVQPFLESIGIGDGKKGIGSLQRTRKTNIFKKLIFKSLGSRKTA